MLGQVSMSLRVTTTVLLLLTLVTTACLYDPFPRVILPARNISEFTLDGPAVYFGAGYHLYRLHLTTRVLEKLYSTDRIRVEQPIVKDGTVYFGGRSHVDEKGNRGEPDGFFAVEVQSGQKLWKFPLRADDGYGTYGTYPLLVEDRILVCARERLHCLDRTTGTELWKVDNWFGRVSDGTTIPYAHKDFVYFKIHEFSLPAKDSYSSYRTEAPNDGHWAKVALPNGRRTEVLSIADKPATYHDTDGTSIGVLADGVVYGATRYDGDSYPASRFGALDVEAKKLMWEVKGIRVRTKPALSTRFVFTIRDHALLALYRQTGVGAWSKSITDIVLTETQNLIRPERDHEHAESRRLAATEKVVIVQGSQGISALTTEDGKQLWVVKLKSGRGSASPLIVGQMVIVTVAEENLIIALDLKNGAELWRVSIPDSQYHYVAD